jgi:cytochrome c556
MKKKLFVLALALLPCIALGSAGNARRLVELPDMMREHMLGNMRDHLAALTEIQDAIAVGAYDQAADIAETRIGMSSLEAHHAAHLAPYMPKPMQDIGTQMHRAASQFALVARETAVDGNVKRMFGALGKITQQCVACHAAYRVR